MLSIFGNVKQLRRWSWCCPDSDALLDKGGHMQPLAKKSDNMIMRMVTANTSIQCFLKLQILVFESPFGGSGGFDKFWGLGVFSASMHVRLQLGSAALRWRFWAMVRCDATCGALGLQCAGQNYYERVLFQKNVVVFMTMWRLSRC